LERLAEPATASMSSALFIPIPYAISFKPVDPQAHAQRLPRTNVAWKWPHFPVCKAKKKFETKPPRHAILYQGGFSRVNRKPAPLVR
jgi:hypothetical protein